MGIEKNVWHGTSLVVPWLELRVFTAEGLGLMPGRGGQRSHKPHGMTPQKDVVCKGREH